VILEFDHTKKELYEALGLSAEEFAALYQKENNIKKILVHSILQSNTGDEKSNISTSELVELYYSQFSKEELAVLASVKLKEECITFFDNNSQMILHVIGALNNEFLSKIKE
jgi:endonuclease III